MITTQKLHKLFTTCNGVSTDTRKIAKGSIFFALKGPNFNGNKYAKDAISKGAKYAVIDEKKYDQGHQYILVNDVLSQLQQLAAHHRSKLSIPIIGITGSNGKTTTKELMLSVLSQKYKVQATIGNLNNHIGVPLTLLSIDQSHEIAIVEIGTNSPGEIAFLTSLTTPTHGLITSIGKAHLEGLINIAGVTKEKTSLFNGVIKNKGVIFINQDDPNIASFTDSKKGVIPYSQLGSQGYTFKISRTYPHIKIDILTKAKQKQTISSSLIGRYNASNILAAISVGIHLKVSLSQAFNGIKSYKASNNRTEKIHAFGATVWLDAYNANPTSMKLAIEEFATAKTTKQKILILGDMFEVGRSTIEEHQSILELVLNYQWKYILLVGSFFDKTIAVKNNSIVYKFKSSDDVNAYLDMIQKQLKGTMILAKGSRSMKLENALKR